MFKKLQRQIDRKKAGAQSLKYRFDLQLGSVEGLPSGVTQCRVLWARGAKVQLSRLADVQNGVAHLGQQLTQVATVYRDPRNQLESKEYSLKVEVPAKGDTSKMLTLGKAVIDMVRYINFANTAEEATVPIRFKVASGGTGFLKVVIHASMLKGYVADDGMTEVSGLTGLSSMNEEISEQDLSGFDDGGHGMADSGSSGNSIPTPGGDSGHDMPTVSPPSEAEPPEAPPKREKKSKSKSKLEAVPEAEGHMARSVSSVAEQELKRRDEELQEAGAEIARLRERLSESQELKKERDSLVLQVKRLERAVNQEARAAHSVEMDALKGALGRAEERVQALEQQNAEQDVRIRELQEELEQESGHRGEEATQMKEVYDSRVAGLKRQIEDEQNSRRELEENFQQQLEEECRKAVEREEAKQQTAMERMKEDMRELRLRAAEDLELLEGRLLEASAEIGRLEKKTSEAQRANSQSVNEKLALERELLESASERTDLEREISRLKKKLSERNEAKQLDMEEDRAVPVAMSSTDDKRTSVNNGPGEEEFMRVVSELALAKISAAEMEGERIKLKRDLYKQKEKYISVASKMTKLETKLMTKEGA